MQTEIFQFSFLSCVVAFVFLSVLIARSRQKARHVRAFLAGTLLTALWSAIAAANYVYLLPPMLVSAAEFARTASWIFIIATVFSITGHREKILPRSVIYVVVGVAAAMVVTAQLPANWRPSGFGVRTQLLLVGMAYMALTILGLLLLENLFRNTEPQQKQGVKFLCFGLGTIFIYDFFYYADAILFRALDADLSAARGFVNALTAPLIAVAVSRAQAWTVDIHVSRKVVFHTAALVACGIYLLAMAGAGYYVRELEGDWGAVFQITFLSGSLALLLVLFASETIRSRAKLFIGQNFFSSKYDYREEWLSYIATISSAGEQTSLKRRILQAFAQIMDCRAAALWLMSDNGRELVPADDINFLSEMPTETANSPFLELLNQHKEILVVDELRKNRELTDGSALARWLLSERHAWIVVPIVHKENTRALLVLGQPLAKHVVDWEDRELLMTIGRQTGSYLAEEQASTVLAESQGIREFNERFAFVAHDLKNVVNQLGLLLKNAEAHGENPEFQRDMLATVSSSVDRMRNMLLQIKEKRESLPDRQNEHIQLDACLERVGKHWQKSKKDIKIEVAPISAVIRGNENELRSALGHLIQNAIDAVGPNGEVALRSTVNGNEVCVEVTDNGPGMDNQFVREKLFQPLGTTKSSGFGMGVYQVRKYIQDMGGRLNVDTSPGQGTRMQIFLPLSGAH